VDLAPGAKRSLILPNPVMVASGTFGYGLEYAKIFDIQRLGGIVTKTTTLHRAWQPAGSHRRNPVDAQLDRPAERRRYCVDT
jgi:dihydroorotate dehydrogenase